MIKKIFPSKVWHVILLFLVSAIVGSIISFPVLMNKELIGEQTSMALSVSIMLFSLLVIVFYKNKKNKASLAINFKLIINKRVLFFFILIIFFSLGINIIQNRFFLLALNVEITPTNPFDFSSIITYLILAPIFEELIFRGIIQTGLKQTYSTKKTIIITSVIFGLVHGDIRLIPQAFLFGLLFGYVYERYNSITLNILLHSFTNVFGLLGGYLIYKFGMNSTENYINLFGENTFYIPLLFAVSFFILLYFLIKKSKIKTTQ